MKVKSLAVVRHPSLKTFMEFFPRIYLYPFICLNRMYLSKQCRAWLHFILLIQMSERRLYVGKCPKKSPVYIPYYSYTLYINLQNLYTVCGVTWDDSSTIDTQQSKREGSDFPFNKTILMDT